MHIRWIILQAWILVGATITSSAQELTFSCAGVGKEYQLCKEAAARWSQKSGVPVRIVSAPNDASERLALYQQMFAVQSPDIDVFSIDVVWPGILSRHLLDLTHAISPKQKRDFFPAALESNEIKGKIIALPWYMDTGFLFYRKDLLDKYQESVPLTWEDLYKTAKKIQDAERKAGNKKLWGYVFQGRAYEGLTCNAMEWLASHRAEDFIRSNGSLDFSNPQMVSALRKARSWIGNITPKGALNYTEEEARGVFQSGNAVFLRNWPYVWKLANGPDSAIAGKFGMTVLPKGGQNGRHAGTLGGYSVAVSKYSKYPKQAVSLAQFLTSESEQKIRLLEGGSHPTLRSLYRDSELLRTYPLLNSLLPAFENAVARPAKQTGSKYNRVSAAIYNLSHRVLSGRGEIPDLIRQLERRLVRYRRGGEW